MVVVTQFEACLDYCLKAIRKIIPNSRVILLSGSGNLGYLRDLALKSVESEFFAFVDSDVIVNREWFDWCMETIKKDEAVAVVQTNIRNFHAKHYDSVQMAFVKRTREYTSLGNCVCRTHILKKLGIPKVECYEDLLLKRRIIKNGFKWLVNVDIACEHLKTDIDVLKHNVRFVRMSHGFDREIRRVYIMDIIHYLRKGFIKYKLSDNVFNIGMSVIVLFASFSKNIHF